MREAGQRSVRIGCSGWNYESWRNGVFYPERCPARLWLETYARSFDTVEVNATFYRLPTTKAVQGWVDQTPDDFCFAVKASRYLTHIKRLRELEGGIARFMERLEPLVRSPKLGPLLWQLPPNFARDDERLAAALDTLPPGRHAFEFRHASWFADDVYDLLKGAGAALCLSEREDNAPPPLVETASWGYVRLRLETYADGDLEQWASRLAATAWREIYVYFMHEPTAPAYAQALMRFGPAPG